MQHNSPGDCLCGAYAKNADERKILEEGDLDEGVDGLLRLKDPKGTPWLDSNALGKGYQRVRSFDDGLRSGPFACGFIGSLVGTWIADVPPIKQSNNAFLNLLTAQGCHDPNLGLKLADGFVV